MVPLTGTAGRYPAGASPGIGPAFVNTAIDKPTRDVHIILVSHSPVKGASMDVNEVVQGIRAQHEAIRAEIVTHATVTVAIHGTPPEIWDTLVRVFGAQTGATSQWVTLEKGDTQVHFYGPRRDEVTP